MTSSAVRPRVLFEDVSDETYQAMAPLAPVHERIESRDEIHTSDWDLVVTYAQSGASRDRSLHVLSFGADVLDNANGGPYVRHQTRLSREAKIPSGIPAATRTLIEETILSGLDPRGKDTWTVKTRAGGSMYPTFEDQETLAGTCVPLVTLGSEGYPYALYRLRTLDQPSNGHCWSLPLETSSPERWLAYVLQELRTLDPERFPSDPLWQDKTAWAPPRLRNAIAEEEQLRVEREKLIADIDRKIHAQGEEISAAKSEALAGPWRLLTTDGDDLVEAVRVALTAFGFTTQDMDDHHDVVTGAKLEDLRVRSPTDSDWTCLVEVKGYIKGAKANDVTQITRRPSTAFAAETHRPADSVWHIVNVHRGTDPSTRPTAIPNDEVDLAPLTEAAGALIDTRDLYRAWTDLMAERTTPTEILASLKSARTRWTWNLGFQGEV